mgnify:CR=1 FL=1
MPIVFARREDRATMITEVIQIITFSIELVMVKTHDFFPWISRQD